MELVCDVCVCGLSGREWEMRVQEYEDEDDDDEPGLWTRVRSLLLTLSLQLYYRMMKAREQLQRAIRMLGGAADMVRPDLKPPGFGVHVLYPGVIH